MSGKRKRKSNTNANSSSSATNALMDGCHDYVDQLFTMSDEDFPRLPVTPSESPAPKKDRRK